MARKLEPEVIVFILGILLAWGGYTHYGQFMAWMTDHALDYAIEGDAKSKAGDINGSIADYSKAIWLDGKDWRFYNNRAWDKIYKGDLDGAIFDSDQAIAIDPNSEYPYLNRGNAQYLKGNTTDAIADFSKSILANPKYEDAYKCRGFVRQLNGDMDGAISDFNQCISIESDKVEYPRFFLFLTRLQQGKKEDAIQELQAFLLLRRGKRSAEDWPMLIGSFLIDHMTETDLLHAAFSDDPKTNSAQHCEAWYYIGMKSLLAGDKKVAVQDFHKCLETHEFDFDEYVMAQYELKILEKAP